MAASTSDADWHLAGAVVVGRFIFVKFSPNYVIASFIK